MWDLTGELANAQLPKKALTERELAVAWDDLKSGEPPVAQKAVVAIACGAPESVAFMGKKLSPVEVADPKRIDALVTELDDRDYRIREIASRALAALGEGAEPALLRAFRSESFEVRTRAGALLLTLKKLDDSPDRTRSIRALAALEYAGGIETRRLLSRYAAGHPASYLTRQAKAALERIARQEMAK